MTAEPPKKEKEKGCLETGCLIVVVGVALLFGLVLLTCTLGGKH